MKLCIAEKPSVAKEIAQIVGAKSRKDGYFEGNGYKVSWTFGHLCTLMEPHDYDKTWKYWNIYKLPVIPQKFDIKVIENKGVQKQFKTLETLIGQANEVINCGDAGQEGELIQRWVLKKANNQKPVKRLWISSLTEEAIKEGFANLKEESEFDRLYLAASSRAIGDWLLGINGTRVYTVKYGQGKQVLSIGRVQTPTLALVVNRQLEIDNFQPYPYWELKTTYKEVLFTAKEAKFNDPSKANEVVSRIKDLPFTITNFTKKKGKDYAPRLFDLTALQVECNKKFGFSADDTLKFIQSLYENKLVSYPRVDTTYLPDDVYPKIAKTIQGIKGYEAFTSEILKNKIRKSKKVFDNKKVTDHHAIIPTGVAANGLNSYLQKVYDVIVKRFLANFMPDCEVARTQVEGIVDDIEFKTSGKEILFPGWRAIYGKDQDQGESKKEDDQILPTFTKGQSGPHQLDLSEKETKPPKFFSEATLLRAMETAGKHVDDDELREAMKENGIGRPSTRANIIETLFRRNYIRRDKKKIIANQTGVELIQTIQNELLKSAELTGQWEKKLRDIELGKYDIRTFMSELKEMVTSIVEDVRKRPDKKISVVSALTPKAKTQQQKHTPKERLPKQKGAKCPKCNQGEVMKGKTAFGCSKYKNGCDFVISFEQFGKKLTDSALKDLIHKGQTKFIKGFKIEDTKKNGVLKLVNFKAAFIEQEEKKEDLACPKCKQGKILKGKTAYGCSNYKNGCDFRIQFTVYGKKISDSQIKSLVLKGKTSNIKGFLDPNTTIKFDGKLYLNDEKKLRMEKA